MDHYVLAFDFSLSSTGYCLLKNGDPQPVADGLIKSEWGGSQWWAPPRYLAFFREAERVVKGLREQVQGWQTTTVERRCWCRGGCVECDGHSVWEETVDVPFALDVAAEAVVWEKEATPALFALHTALWQWAWQWRSRLVYLTYQRWRNLLIERFEVPRADAQTEGKSLAVKLFQQHVGRRPAANDVSDAWGVALAASRFFAYSDGRLKLESLRPKEQAFFDSTSRRKVSGQTVRVPAGLIHERNTNVFDWREKNGQEKSQQ